MDVKSLYTCIPHNDGPQALKFFLDKRRHQSPPTITLLRLAELVLTANAFLFNSQYYLQKSGVAMGSKLGPSYACLFVGHQEQLIYESYDGPLPCLIKRYIDDIVGATSLPLADLQRFINYTSNFHPALQFTHSITEEGLPLLVQPLFLWPISKDSLTTQANFIQPCSLPIQSPKKACHFWTSSLASKTTESQHLSSTSLQMPTASSTTNHHIRRNAKTPSPTLNSAVSAASVQMMMISI